MAKRELDSRTFLFLGLGFLALLTIFSLVVPRTEYPASGTFSAQPEGTKALFLLLNREGFVASRLSSVVPQGPGLMITDDPGGDFSAQDWKRIFDWVERGNTLLIASDSTHELPGELGFETGSVPTSGTQTHLVSSDHPLLKDVGELSLTGGTRLKQHKSMNFAYGDEQGIYLAEIVRKKGRIILLAVPRILTNQEVAQKDNLILLLNIIRLYGQEGIWFSEFTHGYTWEAGVREVFTGPLRLVILQLALAVLMLFYFWGKRFGRPQPLPENTYGCTGDYVISLAHIYRQGRARHLILDSIYQGFRQDLAKDLGASPRFSNEELVNIWSGQRRSDAKALQDLLRRSISLLRKPDLGEKDVFWMAREMAVWREKNLDFARKRRTKHA